MEYNKIVEKILQYFYLLYEIAFDKNVSLVSNKV